ncbi:MAG TPA: glycosyltransferase family 2 protein, partial [Candidatus Binatia bacterium]|nr:glycosyltransferase family 2 protein [Candidatus Binatia bacterium]
MSSTNRPRVVVAIISWNRVAEVCTCIDSVASVAYPNYELLVVDNASRDATVATVRERFPHVTVLRNERNLGYAGGSNVAFRYALDRGADYVLLLNQDVRVAPDLIDRLVEAAESDSRIAIAGAKNRLMDNPAYTWGRYGILNWGPMLVYTRGRYERDYDEPGITDVDWVIGNGCLLRCATLREIGPFDEEFFHFNEDVDWCTRARRASRRVVYVDQAALDHHGSSSADEAEEVASTSGYFLGRTCILFASKHASAWQWLRLLVNMVVGLGLRLAWHTVGAVNYAIRIQWPFVEG